MSRMRQKRGGKNWGIFEAAHGPTVFGPRAQRAAGIKPGPPAHGREPGYPFSAIFGGELIENGYITVLTCGMRRKHGPHQMGTSLSPTKFGLNDDGDETLRRDPLPRRQNITNTIRVGRSAVLKTEFRVNPGPPEGLRHARKHVACISRHVP